MQLIIQFKVINKFKETDIKIKYTTFSMEGKI